jgi:hypothetical protein
MGRRLVRRSLDRFVRGRSSSRSSSSVASAQGFDARSRTVTVAPSGGDDTMAIRQAFATCIAVGPGCTVRLTEGTFVTRQHVIEGFHGAFVGAGSDRTFIEPLAPLYVTDAEMVLMNHPTDEEPWPILFLFIDANMTMADLGFRVTDYEVTTPWNIYGMQITALATLVSLTGQDARVDVERIAMESGEGTFFGVSVINGIFVQGVLPGRAAASGTVRRSPAPSPCATAASSGPMAASPSRTLDGATVSVRDSVFDGVFSVYRVGRVRQPHRDRRTTTSRTVDTAIELTAGDVQTADRSEPRRDHRQHAARACGAQGVTLADDGDAPTLQVLLAGNAFEFDGAWPGSAGSPAAWSCATTSCAGPHRRGFASAPCRTTTSRSVACGRRLGAGRERRWRARCRPGGHLVDRGGERRGRRVRRHESVVDEGVGTRADLRLNLGRAARTGRARRLARVGTSPPIGVAGEVMWWT